MSETFGDKLTRWRESVGLTQAELGGRVGVTSIYIGYLERGSDPTGIGEEIRPMIEVVDAIAEALDVPVAEVRLAAGYEPPEDSQMSGEAVGDTFDESDFAALHRLHEKLDPAIRKRFRPVLEMVRRELELLLGEQVVERESRPVARRRSLNTSRAARTAPTRRA